MFKVKVDNLLVLRAFLRRGPRAIAVLMTRANALMFQLQSKIVSEKLSGQVLHRRSGVLSSSVRAIPAQIGDGKITFGVQAGGGPAFYGRFFEEGGSGSSYEIMAVKGRALKFISHGKTVFAARVTHPALPARPFMKPSAEEFLPTIREELNAAVHQTLNE